eukprot:4239808-Prymnesium_polylepis.1
MAPAVLDLLLPSQHGIPSIGASAARVVAHFRLRQREVDAVFRGFTPFDALVADAARRGYSTAAERFAPLFDASFADAHSLCCCWLSQSALM